jgi:class 3 adenylate cyclase/tetratricopeptide (TPR) repeat protein
MAIISGRDLPKKSEGAVLFADISGFTDLTSRLSKELGVHKGADEITKYLNIIYEAIINRIHDYQGSVISFAGDAITCWFGNDDGRRAIAAGVKVQLVFGELSVKYKLNIGIKVVVSSGPVSRIIVGDPKIQLIDLLVGKTVNRVILAETMAKPGELWVSSSIADKYRHILSIGKNVTTKEGDSFTIVNQLKEDIPSTPWWVEKSIEPGVLPKWILPRVIEKLSLGEERFISELRVTVSLFMKFEGIDFDNDGKAELKVRDFISWVQNCVTNFDGHLLQVIIGDKGDYLYIGFGALSAHEDDAERSVSAAYQIVNPPAELSYIKNIRVGIAMGRMLAGPYGGSNRRTYSMIGESANLAARLMEKAGPGQVLVTQKLASAIKKRFAFKPAGSLDLKGFNKPVPALFLEGHKKISSIIPTDHNKLIGRNSELGQLLEYAEGIRSGTEKGLILMSGEGGIGKSSLINEAVRKIKDSGTRVISASGYAIENSTPYFTARELLKQLLEADEETPLQISERVSSVLSGKPDLIRFIPLLNDILSVGVRENELTAQMQGNIRADNLNLLVNEIFKSTSINSSYLLILDDAHWIDSASWSLIRSLKNSMPELGLIIAYRPFAISKSGELANLIDNSMHKQLELTNLGPEDTGILVGNLLGVKELPSNVQSLIYDKTSGHPFFSEELAYSLLNAGIIKIENESCRFVSGEEMVEESIPNTIQTAIISRLDRLTAPQQLSVKVASILGRLFVFNAVLGIHPTPPGNRGLRDQLNEISRLNLITKQITGPETSYSFKQSIIHEVAYNMLSYSQRFELHQKAALWYENHYYDDLSKYYSHLGYHWQKAEVYYKAIDYMEKAAIDAIAKGAYRDGIKFIEQTLILTRYSSITRERRAALLIEMGVALFKIGELEDARRKLISGIRILKHRAAQNSAGMLISLMAGSYRQFIIRIKKGRIRTVQGEKRDIHIRLSRAYEYLAQSYFHQNKLFFSLDAGLASLNSAELAGPSAQLARAYGSLCVSSSTMPIPGLYEEYARLARTLLTDGVGLDDNGRILELIAVALSGKGRWEEVRDLCTKAMEMADEIGDRFLFMENTCILAAGLLHNGHFDESKKLREELLTIGKKDQVDLVQGWAHLQLAEVALQEGDFGRSREHLLSADSFEQALGQPDKLWLQGLHAITSLMLKDEDLAFSYGEKALKLSRQSLPTSFFVLEGYSGMINAFFNIYSASPQNSLYAKRLRQAFNSFSKYASSFPIGKPRFFYWKAMEALRKKKDKQAEKYKQKGLSIAGDMNMVFEEKLLMSIPV